MVLPVRAEFANLILNLSTTTYIRSNVYEQSQSRNAPSVEECKLAEQKKIAMRNPSGKSPYALKLKRKASTVEFGSMPEDVWSKVMAARRLSFIGSL